MNYPLTLSFKIIALAPQVSVTDSQGQLLLYIRQKLFKLREAVNVFADQAQTRQAYSMQADRVLDISAQYNISDSEGVPLGAVKRQGMRSLWRAHYDIAQGETPVMTIREENAWIKFIDMLIGEVPILNLFTGYILHPAYLITRQDGTLVMRVEKQPAFFEGKFLLEQKAPMEPAEEQLALLSVLMMLLLERRRG